jgi:nitrite reductase/ring-hydroxylating ferredoxin subunit
MPTMANSTTRDRIVVLFDVVVLNDGAIHGAERGCPHATV